jgi:hypothetical protein
VNLIDRSRLALGYSCQRFQKDLFRPHKGTVSRDLNYVAGYFLICADGFSGLSITFRNVIQISNFYLLL